MSSKARMVYMVSSRTARNPERSSVSEKQKNVERKPRRRNEVRDGVSKSSFICQWIPSMLLPALKAVLMLCKTIVWCSASNTGEVKQSPTWFTKIPGTRLVVPGVRAK